MGSTMDKRRFSLNLVGQIAAFFLTVGVSFFVSPYIISSLGNEAYGFVNLVNTFVSYISVITVALNGMCGRYITISYHDNKLEDANEYFSSVFLANLVLSIISVVLSVFLVSSVELLLDIPESLVKDVKVTIFLSFLNFAISLNGVVFGLSTFITNRLYISSAQNIIGKVLYTLIIAVVFFCFKPRIWFLAVASIGASIFSLATGVVLTRKLTPNLSLDIGKYNKNKVVEIIKSGIWMSIESLNKLLQTGFDLLITNLFVGPNPMGVLAIAKTMPNMLTSLNATVAGIYSPNYAKLYAENRINSLAESLKSSIRFLTFFMSVPLMGFLVFGERFYTLWLPLKSQEEIHLIQILSVFTVLPLVLNSHVEGLYYINVLLNKVKISVLVTTAFSVASIVTTIVLLALTDGYDLYIVAGVSSVYMVLRIIVFTPIYCASILHLPRMYFYPTIIRGAIANSLVLLFFVLVRASIHTSTWFALFLLAIAAGSIGYMIEFFICLSEGEKQSVKSILFAKVKKVFRNEGKN